MARRRRKQRVVLRARQRVEVHRHTRRIFLSGLLAGGLSIVTWQAISHPAVWAPRFIQSHTPRLEVQAPATLTDLPLLKQPQTGSFALWFPGFDIALRRRWLKDNPAVANVRFEKRFSENRVIARLEPRIPLAHWDNHALDKDGTVFTLASVNWAPLPKAWFANTATLRPIGNWLAEISRHPEIWNQVIAVSQDPRGEMWLDMTQGTRVAWGLPDLKSAPKKARCLALVLEDAHQRLSGAATADLRFFEEGRVIVKPKSAV